MAIVLNCKKSNPPMCEHIIYIRPLSLFLFLFFFLVLRFGSISHLLRTNVRALFFFGNWKERKRGAMSSPWRMAVENRTEKDKGNDQGKH